MFEVVASSQSILRTKLYKNGPALGGQYKGKNHLIGFNQILILFFLVIKVIINSFSYNSKHVR